MKFSIKDFFSKCDQIRSFQMRSFHFLCSAWLAFHQDIGTRILSSIKCHYQNFTIK